MATKKPATAAAKPAGATVTLRATVRVGRAWYGPGTYRNLDAATAQALESSAGAAAPAAAGEG